MPDTTHYLRDAKTGKKIGLETSGNRLTILVKEKDPVAIKNALSPIRKMPGITNDQIFAKPRARRNTESRTVVIIIVSVTDKP